MEIAPETIQLAWNNFWLGISIHLQLLDLFLPDEWEVALFVLSGFSAIVTGIIVFIRKKYYL